MPFVRIRDSWCNMNHRMRQECQAGAGTVRTGGQTEYLGGSIPMLHSWVCERVQR